MAKAVRSIAESLPAARNGSGEALGEALEACRVYLQAIAERDLNPELRAKGGASDLVQQTFLEAQQGFGQFHGDTEDALLAWLRKMLLNNLSNFRRQYQGTAKRQANLEIGLADGDSAHQAAAELPADTLTPSRQLIQIEDDEELQQAIARLPDDYQNVIRLRYQEGRPFDEIAKSMQRSENAVQKLWLRAVERLQRELQTPP
jgi:RNA polymerase sigma-70 factor (ECF subfamily)